MVQSAFTRPALLVSASLALMLTTGCGQKKSGEEESPTKTTETAKPKSSAKEAASAEATATGSAGAAKAPSTAAPKPVSIPGRSAIPSIEEWNGVGEVTVKGSSALNCETKMVREWLRVSCRGKNDTGGTPTTVRITKGGKPGTYVYHVGGVTSLITPFVNGVHLEAAFSWTDKSHKLVVDWPNGAPKPTIMGVFEGAKSPLDRLNTGTPKSKAYACACGKQFWLQGIPVGAKDAKCTTQEIQDEEVNEDCYYSYPNDCTLYSKCALGEPAVMPRCRPGHTRIWVNLCSKTCTADSDCTGGETCIPSTMDPSSKACM